MKKENEKYHKTFMDKLIDIIIFFGSLCIVALFVFIYSTTVNASSESGTANGSLPYKYSQIMTYNSFMNNDIIYKLRTLNLPVDSEDYVLMYSDHSPFIQYPQYNNQYDVTYYFFLLPIEDFNSVYDGFNFYSNNLSVNLTSNSYYYYIAVTCDLTSNFELIAIRTPSYTPYSTSLYNSGMFGHIPSIDSVSGFSFTPFTPVYFNRDFYSTNDVLVLDFSENGSVPIVTGHATPPDEFQNPVYTQGHSKPEHVPPTITVNNYSWTTYTPPTIDDSGIIEVIKSEIQVINYLAGWLKDNLQGMLTNLVNNIKNLFDYLVETIQYYGDLIISNIQNLITTFYNNMVSIGQNITDKLTYIVSPLDTSALQTAIENTGIYNDYDRIFDMVGDAFGFYNDITEPNTFSIPIDLRNVTILHQTQIVYIDLGWLNSCKTIIRAFMWCVLTFGLLYTIIDSIPDYLNGNDE